MIIYCCGCENNTDARLTTGEEIYPHREDLFSLPFWVCDSCENFVGCHHKTKNRTEPLGCIPTKAIRDKRKHIHAVLDPMWQNLQTPKERRKKRGHLYSKISKFIGRPFHTGNITSFREAENILLMVYQLKDSEPTK